MNRSRRNWLIAAGLTLLTLASFAAVWRYGFVSVDDHIYVTDNPHVTAGLTWSGVRWAFTTGYANFWHPMTWVSLMLDAQLFGAGAGAMHVTSLLLHLAATLALFAALARMTGRPAPSALVAGLFAVHPQHVESVAWISQRKDVLSTAFMMLALWTYAAYADRRRQGEPAAWAFAGVTGLFVLGLMAKPMLVTLPFLLLLLDWWPLGRMPGFGSGRSAPPSPGRGGAGVRALAPLVAEKLALFAIAVAASVVAFMAQKQGGAVGTLASFPLAGRVANALHSSVAYIAQAIWPTGLAAFYPYPQEVAVLPAAGALALLAAITAVVVLTARRRPYLAVGWFWYLGTLLPVSGLVQVGSHAMADRYTYVPTIGLFIVVAWGAAEIAGRVRLPRWAPVAVSCAVLLVCAVMTRAQVETWKDSAALWRHAIDVVPGNYYAHNGLGLELVAAGRREEAKAHFVEAGRLAPGFPNSHNNLGLILAAENRPAEAAAEFQKALALDPDYAQAHVNLGNVLLEAGRPEEAAAHFSAAGRAAPALVEAVAGLGNALLEGGRPDAAVERLRDAVAANTTSGPSHYNLANALLRAGRLQEAAAEYRESIRLEPKVAVEARTNLGAALMRMGRLDEAAVELGEALRLDPGSTRALNNLGGLALQAGRPAEAADRYRAVIRLSANDADAHMNLGNALFDLGQLEEAEKEQRLAVKLAPASPNAHYNLGSTLEHRGRVQAALAEYRETLRIEGPSPDLLCAAGRMLERLGRTADAAACYREALGLDPGHKEASAGVARLAVKRGSQP
jgi:tetratricopeptide (TPR) repeat protein